MKAHQPTTHETFCVANADHFVATRGRSAFGRTRETFPTINEAEAYAATFGDGRTMIYAVTPAGHSAHIKNA